MTIHIITFPICVLRNRRQSSTKYNLLLICNCLTYYYQMDEDTPIVIIECCTNCKYHVWCTRHSQWKYNEHFTEIKRKLQKSIKSAVVVKNPTPDNLLKLDDPTGEQNKYFNEQTQQVVLFPRLGAFEVYIYDMLVFSKLQTNQWPHHTKLIERLQSIVEDRRQGVDIAKYSIEARINNSEMLEPLAPKIQPNSMKTLELQREEKQEKEQELVEDVKLPPASKIYRKIYKSIDREKPPEKSPSPNKKPKPKKPTLQKTQPRKLSVQIPKAKDPNTSLPIIHVNQGEPRDQMRTDKSNFTEVAMYTVGLRSETYELKGGSQQRDGPKARKPQESDYIEIRDRIVHSEQMMRQEEQDLSEIQSEKVLDEFTKDFHPVRLKDLDKGSMSDSRQGKRPLPIRQRMKLAQVYNEIVCKPKQKSFMRVTEEIVNLEIIEQRAARLPRLRIKKQFSDVLNKEIIDEKNNRPMKIMKQLAFDVNREIIEQKAKIPPKIYEDTQIQMTERDYSDCGQQIQIILQAPGEYAKECIDMSVQAVDTIQDIDNEDYSGLLRRSVSIQMTIPDEEPSIQYETHSVQFEVEQANQQTNTDPIIKKTTQEIGINTEEVVIKEKQPEPPVIIEQPKQPSQISPELQPMSAVTEDKTFTPLSQTRKNILDSSSYYSVERFQHNVSKYRWTARANLQPEEVTRTRFMREQVLLSLYRLLGFRTAKKQLSFQYTANMPEEEEEGEDKKKPVQLLLHTLSEDMPELKYLPIFNEHSYNDNLLIKSQLATLKISKNPITLNGYGQLLSAAKFLNDLQLVSSDHLHVGFELKGSHASDFTKVTSENYDQETRIHDCQPRTIELSLDGTRRVKFDELSPKLKVEFIEGLSKVMKLRCPEDIIKSIGDTDLFADREAFEKVFNKNPERFANFYVLRRQELEKEYGVELRMFAKYGTLEPKLKKYWVNTIYLAPHVVYNEKRIPIATCLKQHFQNDQKRILVIKGSSSIGKTSCLAYLKKFIDTNLRTDSVVLDLNIPLSLDDLKAMQKKLKNTINLLIDNYQQFPHFQQLIKLFNINLYPSKRLILTSDTSNFVEQSATSAFVVAGIDQLMEQCELTGFDDNEITHFMRKHMEQHGPPKGVIADEVSRELVKLDESRRVISNPALLNYVMHFLSEVINSKDPVSRFGLLKILMEKCQENHQDLCIVLGVKYESAEETLKLLAMKLFKEGWYSIATADFLEAEKFVFSRYVKNLLELYPMLLTEKQYGFYHNSFLHYFVTLAMSQIVEKGYKGVRLNDITKSREVIQLLKQRYSKRGGQSRLLQIINQSKSNPHLSQQSSNAITLLSKIGFIFSDLNMQGVSIPSADLSFSVMYNTNMRSSNLDSATLFNCSLINCTFDGCSVNAVDFGMRKYGMDKDIYSGALSQDGKLVGVSSGNNVLLLNSENGRQEKLLVGHTDLVKVVEFSRDGKSVISISDDRSIRIWNLKTFSPIVLKVPSKTGIKFSPEAQRICCITKDTVRIWSIKLIGGQVTLKRHTDEVKYVAFSANGQRVVTASKDKSVMLWTIQGDFLKDFLGHKSQVHYASFSPSGRNIASASHDNTIRIWDISKGVQVQRYSFSSRVSCLCYSPEEKYLLAACTDEFEIKALNLKSQQEAFTFQGHEDEVLNMDFDKLGQRIITASSDKTVRVWNFKKYRETQFTEGHSKQVWCVASSKTNDFFASASADKSVKLWDSKTGDQLRTFYGHTEQVFTVSFSPLGKKIASGGQDKTVIIWDVLTGDKLHVSHQHKDWVYCVSFSNDGYLLASGDSVGIIIIWDVYAEKITHRLEAHEAEVFSMSWNTDNSRLASGSGDKIIKIWNVADGSKVTQLASGHTDNIWCVRYINDQTIASGGKDALLVIWNIQTGQIINRMKNDASIQSIVIINSQKMALSSQNGMIKVLEIATTKQIKQFTNPQSIWNIDVCRDRQRLISAGGDNTIRLWRLDTNTQKFSVKFGTLVFNKTGSISANLTNHRQLTLTDLIEHKQSIHNLPSAAQSISFTVTNNLLLLKADDSYSQYDTKTKQEKMVDNINDYNVTCRDLLVCRGKFVRDFEGCSWKKLRGATDQVVELLEE